MADQQKEKSRRVRKGLNTRRLQDESNFGESVISDHPLSESDDEPPRTQSRKKKPSSTATATSSASTSAPSTSASTRPLAKHPTIRSLPEVAKLLKDIMQYDFEKNFDVDNVVSWKRIVEYLAEWLNAGKLPFNRVKEFFEEETGKTGRMDGGKAIRLFAASYFSKFSVKETLLKRKFPEYTDGRSGKKVGAPSTYTQEEKIKYRKRVDNMREYKLPSLLRSTFHNPEAIPILASLFVAIFINTHEIDRNDVSWENLEKAIDSKIVKAAREQGTVRPSSTNATQNIVEPLRITGLPPAPSFEGMGEEAYIADNEAESNTTTKSSNALLVRAAAAKNVLLANAELERASNYRNRAIDKVELAKVALKANDQKLAIYKMDQQGRDSLRKVTGCGGERDNIYVDAMKLVSVHLQADGSDENFLASFAGLRKRLADINQKNPDLNFIPAENDYENVDELDESVVQIISEGCPSPEDKHSKAHGRSSSSSKSKEHSQHERKSSKHHHDDRHHKISTPSEPKRARIDTPNEDDNDNNDNASKSISAVSTEPLQLDGSSLLEQPTPEVSLPIPSQVIDMSRGVQPVIDCPILDCPDIGTPVVASPVTIPSNDCVEAQVSSSPPPPNNSVIIDPPQSVAQTSAFVFPPVVTIPDLLNETDGNVQDSFDEAEAYLAVGHSVPVGNREEEAPLVEPSSASSFELDIHADSPFF